MVDENKEQEEVTAKNSREEEQDSAGKEDIEVAEENESDAEESEVEEVTVEALQEKLDDSQDKLMRVAAEFENFKRRMEREKSKLLKYAGENILRDLVTIVDNIDRAIEQGKAEADDDTKKLESMLEGLELTRKGISATLEKFEVELLESVGKEFNPDEQDALTMEASEAIPANHVLREFAKGYRFKDRVLRHAQVVVSSGPKE